MPRSRLSPLSLLLATLTLLAAVTCWGVSAAPAYSVDDPLASTSTVSPTAADPPATATSTDAPVSTSTATTGTPRAVMREADIVATAWYPGWMSTSFPPSAIAWTKYNMMTFAFALTTEDPSVLDLAGEEETLNTFASEAKKNNVTCLISVGGWTGSQHFSTAVATEEGRAAFKKAILDMVTEYGLDGVDFDWEYPNQAGIGCNTKSPQDTENFLTFLNDLRADPAGANLVLTAAVSIKPFTGTDEAPVQDVSGFAQALDFLAIMNYDIWGAWADTTGPNAPLKDSCAAPESRLGSAESAVAAWTGAGFPAEQLLLGVAAYGRSFHVDLTAVKTANGTLNPYAAFDKSNPPLGEGETSTTPVANKCGDMEGPGGIWTFRGLIESGILSEDGNPGEGVDYTFDECSQTPFAYKQDDQTLISFDDARSFAAKGEFINDQNLRGFAVWHVAGDSSDNTLLAAMHKGIGIETDCSEGSTDGPTDEPEANCPEESTDGTSDGSTDEPETYT